MEIEKILQFIKNFWTLAGLVILIFATLIKFVIKIDENLAQEWFKYLFILGMTCVILGFLLSVLKENKPQKRIKQTIRNNQGTAFNVGGSINSSTGKTANHASPKLPNSVEQEIIDNKGTAINAGNDAQLDQDQLKK